MSTTHRVWLAYSIYGKFCGVLIEVERNTWTGTHTVRWAGERKVMELKDLRLDLVEAESHRWAQFEG